jgi:hypothetical protein
MSSSVRDITESTEAEGRDDTHHSRMTKPSTAPYAHVPGLIASWLLRIGGGPRREAVNAYGVRLLRI